MAFLFSEEVIALGSPYGNCKINIPLFKTCLATSEVFENIHQILNTILLSSGSVCE
jgi:hypothetical protein